MMSKQFFLERYLYYRHGTEGYQGVCSSDSDKLIPAWARGVTRTTTNMTDRPTVELQSEYSDDGQREFVLCYSMFYTKLYKWENGERKLQPVRSDSYTDYLMLPFSREDTAEAVDAASRMLLKKGLFLDHDRISDIVNNDELQQVDAEDVNEAELYADFNEVRTAEKSGARLSGDNLALFLARYWEACWNRKANQNRSPLILITTSGARWNKTDGATIIPDGVLFFCEYILPHLPEAVKPIISISFGCLADAPEAQPGTACMVCKPDAAAMNAPILYDASNDGVYDDNTAILIYLKAGCHMLGIMPRAYTLTCELSDYGESIGMNFDFFYSVCDFECKLDEIENKETKEDRRRVLLKECLSESLPILRDYLREYTDAAETARILYELELHTISACAKLVSVYDAELYSLVMGSYVDLSERCASLDDNEARELKAAYIDYLAKEYRIRPDWITSPLMQLCGQNMTADIAEGIEKVAGSNQNYDGDFNDCASEVLDVLLSGQIRARAGGFDGAADAVLKYILERVEQNNRDFNASVYIEKCGSMLSAQNADTVRGDIKKILHRHNAYVTDVEPLFDVKEAMRELEFESHLVQLLTCEPFVLESVEIQDLMNETQQILPKWCCAEERDFDAELYEAMLDRAIAVTTSKNYSDTQKQIYSNCVTAPYAFEEQGACRLAVLMKYIVNQYPDEWDAEICRSTASNAVLVPCNAKELVAHIAALRANGRHSTAELYFELLEQADKYEDEKSPDYVFEYLNTLEEYRRTVGAEKEKLEKQAGDVGRLLKRVYDAGMRERSFAPSPACMEQIARWYAMHRADCSRDVVESIENVFTYALSYAAGSHNERVYLVRFYCEIAKLYQNDIDKFWKELLSELGNCDIDELMQGNDAVPAVKEYIHFDSKRKREITGLLKKAVEKKIEISSVLSPADAASVINVSKNLGLDECIEEIEFVLANSLEGNMTEKVLNELCEYASAHGKDEVQKIKNCLNNRCDHKPEEISRFKDLLRFMESSYRSGTKASFGPEALANQLKATLEQTLIPECGKPDAELMNLVLEQAIDAKQYLGNITEDMMRWYETFNMEPENRYECMTELVRKMGIPAKEASTSVWRNFFMRYSCEVLCGNIRTEHFSLYDLIEMSSKEDSVQIKEQAVLPENSEMLENMKQLITYAIKDAIKDDGKLQNADYLAEQAGRVNEIKPESVYDLYPAALKNEIYRYFAGVLKDDKSFCALAHDAKSVRDLSKGVNNAVNIDDEAVKRRVKALGNACKLLDFYDGYSGAGSQITEALSNRLNVEGIGNLSQICAEYGKKLLCGKDQLTAAVPTLIDKVTTLGDKPQFKWIEYLEETFPLESPKGWAKADIWHDNENVFGMLASVFMWLSEHKLEKLKESFGDYLKATKLGETARHSSDMNSFMKHCKKETVTSPMLEWIFGLK